MRLLLFIAFLQFAFGEIVNHNVATYITVNTHIAQLNHKINFTNIGPKSVNQYVYIDSVENPIATFYDQFDNRLQYEEFHEVFINKSYVKYVVNLREKVKPMQSYMIFSQAASLGKVTPMYVQVPINFDIMVAFRTNMFFYSPYYTELHRVFLMFNASRDYVYPENVEVQWKDNVMQYSSSNLEPFSYRNVRFIFPYNRPIHVVKDLSRYIHVSMHGKIFVEDHVVLENRAPRFLGNYHDIFYNKDIQKTFYTFLPASAENVKYFDHLGNNSFSSLIYSDDDITLKHSFRYPLFGGWKYSYVVQYYVPIHEYMFTDELGTYYLQMRAIDHVVSVSYVENALTKISLPEFASNVKVTIPKRFNRRDDEVTRFSLTVLGNPTVVMNGSYLPEDATYPVMVKFSYQTYFSVSPAILMTVYIESVFLLYLIWMKILA